MPSGNELLARGLCMEISPRRGAARPAAAAAGAGRPAQAHIVLAFN